MPPTPWTKEPWKVVPIILNKGKEDEFTAYDICPPDEKFVICDGANISEPNAIRIVACVNALAGLNPAAVAQVVIALKECLPLLRDEWKGTNGLIGEGKRVIEQAEAALQALQQEDSP